MTTRRSGGLPWSAAIDRIFARAVKKRSGARQYNALGDGWLNAQIVG
jgi:hypothetical protein